VNRREFKRWLAAQGCTFESKKSGSGHLIVRRGKRKSELPMHGGRKELGLGLVNKIKSDLGLK
jgi:mRNA interferase HicA